MTIIASTSISKKARQFVRGQSLIEYAILVGAIILAVSLTARMFYDRFVDHAQRIEQKNVVF